MKRGGTEILSSRFAIKVKDSIGFTRHKGLKTQVRSIREHELYNASIIIFRVHLCQGKGVINVSETQIHDVHTVD